MKKIYCLFFLFIFLFCGCSFSKREVKNDEIKYDKEIIYEHNSLDSNYDVKDLESVISKRLNLINVDKYKIVIDDKYIKIKLVDDSKFIEIKKVLSKVGKLSFRNSKDELVMTADVLKSNGVKVVADQNNVGNYYLTLEIADVDTFHKKTEEIRKAGDFLVIWLDFDEEKDKFSEQREQCGSLNNSRCISYASINGELTGTSVQLAGNFSYEEASSLRDLINSGSLPFELKEK